MKKNQCCLIGLLLMFWVNLFYAQQPASYIKTIQLERTDLALAYPILLLNSDDELQLSFDDLHGGVTNYYCTFIHCNQNWEPSGLTLYDYMDGFEQQQIEEYDFSFATTQKYTHYTFTFPNDDVQFKQSGNYQVQVFSDDADTPVIVKQFYIWEDVASITAIAVRPNAIDFRNEFHEINFTVDIKNTDVSNAHDEIRVTLMQNGRLDNAYFNLNPRLITNDMLYYDNDDIVFPAVREFRRFDIESLRFQTDRIKKITKENGRAEVFINVDESRIYHQYFYETDINGQFVINTDDYDNSETEADYAWVHFTLQYPYFITSGEFYVFGDLSNWTTGSDYKMEYNFDTHKYAASILLKQGYYNYMYAFEHKETGKIDFTYAEGNHFEAENDYTVFVYQHIYDRSFDRLIGCSIINSLKK